jgi:hypothetical protein
MTIDQQKIRCRLLNKLGIYQETSSSSDSVLQRRQRLLQAHGLGPMTSLASSPPDGSALHWLLDYVVPFEEPLKCHDCDRLVDSKPLKATKIHFSDKVSVVPIPTRHEYSNRIKSRIWTNRYELAELQERNVLEFTAEGWNWEAVVEDDQMFLDSVSGEMVHPIHVQMLQARERDSMNDFEKESTTCDVTSVCDFVP